MSKILLVEDDPAIHRMYLKLFSLEGHEARLAENGADGLKELEEFTPDIILLDIMMKTMNGFEMLAELKKNPKTKDIPVIILTNMSDVSVTNEATKHGANLVIVKSDMDPEQVLEWINSLIAKSKAGETNPENNES